MADDRIVLRAALALLGRRGQDTRHVLSWRVYEDRVAIVVESGHKYVVPIADIVAPGPLVFDELLYTRQAYRLAVANDIDPRYLVGTGTSGRVTVRDVRRMM